MLFSDRANSKGSEPRRELVEHWGTLGMAISMEWSRNEGMKDIEEEDIWSENKMLEFTIVWAGVALDDDKGSGIRDGLE